MKILIPTIILVFVLTGFAKADDLKYSTLDIPKELQKNATSIVRDYKTTFTVIDLNKAKQTVHYVITIMDQKASDEAEFRVYYDNLSTVSNLKFRIYNAFGMDITRTFKSLEIKDESATDEGTLYSDDRCKVISPVLAQFPVTVEYSYEESFSDIIHFPRWLPVTTLNMACQSATMELITPKSLKFRYKNVTKVPDPVIKNGAENDHYTWAISNFAAIEDEPFSPPVTELLPYLIIAPGQIKLNEYNASFETWNDLGKYRLFLLKDRDALPPETVLKLRKLVKDCQDTLCIIKTIYNYLQQHTRYIGVQVGIGGWQPMPAEFVDKKGYGDCKGLVNYTRAMLKAVGIKSFYSLVNAGRNPVPVITDFPCEQFNHIILCVPTAKDTTWLECTSQQQAFGFLGSFTDNRNTLVVNENGGTMVETPKYGVNENTSFRTTQINLDPEGDASVKTFTINKGLESEIIESVYFDSPDEQRKNFYKQIGFSDCKIKSLAYTLTGDYIPTGTESAELFVPDYASKSGIRYFVPVVIPDCYIKIPQNTIARKNPVVVRQSFFKSDTLQLIVPEGLATEFIPSKQLIESKFGNYSLSVDVKDREIQCVRSLTVYANRYEAAEFTELVAFLKKISKADLTKLVFTEKQN